MNRNITGTIRKTDGTVWAGAVIEFELERSSFDESAQYPVKPVHAKSNAGGEISLSLWINEEASRPSRYICTLPDGSQFRFTLPEGSAAVDLNELRENAIEEDSPTQSDQVAFLPLIRSQAQQVVDQSLIAVNAEIDTKADQSALDATNDNVGQIVEDIDTLGRDIEQRATQFDLDTTNANLTALGTVVAAKANQSALNTTNSNLVTTNTNLATTNSNLAAANAAIATKANQSSLDTTNANVTIAFTAIGSRAKQSDLDLTNDNINQVVQNLDALSNQVDEKASQDDLNVTNAGIDSLWVEVETKARQTALNTTNANLAAANAVIATKANQSSLDTTNTNLAAANAAIALRATQFALNVAINDLQTAITDAQEALQNSIDLKADISHTHVSGDVLGDNSAAIAFFDAEGVLASSDQLTYFDGKFGLGTNEPEYAMDVRQYNSGDGSTSRIVADLSTLVPNLQVIADDIQGENAQLSLIAGNRAHTITGNRDRSLTIGTLGETTQLEFALTSGQTYYCGLYIGDGPTASEFPTPGSFGFYLTEHGDLLQLFFNYNGEIRTVDFAGGGGGIILGH